MAFGREQIPRMLESVLVLFSHVQERELVAHHVEVNPLPAQLCALGRDGLRSPESSRRVDGEPFVFHNLREDLVLADVSICSSASRPSSSLPRHTALWPSLGETALSRSSISWIGTSSLVLASSFAAWQRIPSSAS